MPSYCVCCCVVRQSEWTISHRTYSSDSHRMYDNGALLTNDVYIYKCTNVYHRMTIFIFIFGIFCGFEGPFGFLTTKPFLSLWFFHHSINTSIYTNYLFLFIIIVLLFVSYTIANNISNSYNMNIFMSFYATFSSMRMAFCLV